MNQKSAIKKPQKKKKIKNLISKLLFYAVIIIFFLLSSSLQLRKPISADIFQEILEAKGYEVIDTTNQYMDYEYIIKSFETNNDNLYIEFSQVDSKQTAASLYENNKAFLENELRASSNSSEGTTYNQKNYLSNTETFFAIACYEDTFLYAYTDKSDKSAQDVIKEIVSEFKPPSSLLIIVLLVFGGVCIFLSIGFILQEKGKRNRCNVVTIATVIGNEEKHTTETGDSMSYSPIISYYANSEPIQSTYGNGLPKPIPEGTKVDIKYNNKQPEEFCFGDEKREIPFLYAAVFFGLLGMILIGIAIILLIKAL